MRHALLALALLLVALPATAQRAFVSDSTTAQRDRETAAALYRSAEFFARQAAYDDSVAWADRYSAWDLLVQADTKDRQNGIAPRYRPIRTARGGSVCYDTEGTVFAPIARCVTPPATGPPPTEGPPDAAPPTEPAPPSPAPPDTASTEPMPLPPLPPNVWWYDPGAASPYAEQSGNGPDLVVSGSVPVVGDQYVINGSSNYLTIPLGTAGPTRAGLFQLVTADPATATGSAYLGRRHPSYFLIIREATGNGMFENVGVAASAHAGGVQFGPTRGDAFDALVTGSPVWSEVRDLDLSGITEAEIGRNGFELTHGAIYFWAGDASMTASEREQVEAHAGALLEPRGLRPAYLPAPSSGGAVTLGQATPTAVARPLVTTAQASTRTLTRATSTAVARPLVVGGAPASVTLSVVPSGTVARPLVTSSAPSTRTLSAAPTTTTARPLAVTGAASTRTLSRAEPTAVARPLVLTPGDGSDRVTLAPVPSGSVARPLTATPTPSTATLSAAAPTALARPLVVTPTGSAVTLARVGPGTVARPLVTAAQAATRTLSAAPSTSVARPLVLRDGAVLPVADGAFALALDRSAAFALTVSRSASFTLRL